MSPERVNSRSVTAVHARLREAIISGQIKAGSVSTQLALSRELGAGRTPLREALRLLQKEGLIVGEPNRRVQVASLTAADLEEVYGLRIMLETTAVRFTVPSLTSADIAEMRGYVAQMDHYSSDHDWAGLRAPHKAFHEKLIERGGDRTVALITELFDHGERYRMAYVAPSSELWEQRQTEHLALVAAAAERDAEATARLLTEHYTRTALLVLDTFETDGEPKRLQAAIESVALTPAG